MKLVKFFLKLNVRIIANCVLSISFYKQKLGCVLNDNNNPIRKLQPDKLKFEPRDSGGRAVPLCSCQQLVF